MVKCFEYKFLVLILSICMGLSSCESVEQELESLPDKKFDYVIKLTDYVKTRGREDGTYKTGDKLYFYFKGNLKSDAVATYGSDSQWHITLNKELQTGDSGNCNVVFAEGGELGSTEYDYYKLDSFTSLYGTEDGQWEYYNGEISVYAHLSPQQVKVQFISENETEIMIKGVQPQDIFSVKSFSHWTYNDKYMPCFPQTIKVNNKSSDGKYYSEYYYCLGLGTDFYHTGTNHHYHYSDIPNSYGGYEKITEPCNLKYIYIYDRANIQKCYRREFPTDISNGCFLQIKVPTPNSHEGWEMIDNQIKIIDNTPRGVYIETGITNNCGFSVNFSVRKPFESPVGAFGLTVKVGLHEIFQMYKMNSTWENYSGISYEDNTQVEITFVGKAGDASDSPYNYYKDISYSHFPYYSEFIEEREDYE